MYTFTMPPRELWAFGGHPTPCLTVHTVPTVSMGHADAIDLSRANPFLFWFSAVFAFLWTVFLVSRCTAGFTRNAVSPLIPSRTPSAPSLVDKSSPIAHKSLAAAKDSTKPRSTVEVESDAFRALLEERLQLHAKVKSLEKSSAALRSRVWSLEDFEKTQLQGIRRQVQGLVDMLDAEREAAVAAEREKTAEAVAERDAAVKDRGAVARENAELRAERDALRTQKDAIAADLEALHAETETEVDAFSGSKTVLDLEEKLAREAAKATRADAEVKRLQEELHTAKAHLATVPVSEHTVDERGNLHSVNTELQDELRTTKASLTLLQAEHDQQRIQVAAYNKALEHAKEERLELNITVDFLTHFQEGLLDLIGQRDAQVAKLEASLAESAPSDA